MTPTAYKNSILIVASRLAASHPDGFRRSDVASIIGADNDRLGRCLKTLRKSGVLQSAGRGLYKLELSVGSFGALGPGIDIASRVAGFMSENGGMAKTDELRHALSLNTDAERRALHRVLRQQSYDTVGSWWLAPQLAWRSCVLPGWRIPSAVKLELGRYDLVADMAFRSHLGSGVREARESVELEIEDVVSGAVGDIMSDDMLRSAAMVLQSEGARTLSDHWSAQVARLGRHDARTFAWINLEDGYGVGQPGPGPALSTRFWRALADLTKKGAVELSRGRPLMLDMSA